MVGVAGDKVWHLQKKCKQAFSHVSADLKHNRGNEVVLLLEDTGLSLPDDTCILAVTWEKRNKSVGGHHMLTHTCAVPGLEQPRLRVAETVLRGAYGVQVSVWENETYRTKMCFRKWLKAVPVLPFPGLSLGIQRQSVCGTSSFQNPYETDKRTDFLRTFKFWVEH